MFKRNVAIISFLLLFFSANTQIKLFVATNGNDKNSGSLQKPFKSLQQAIAVAQGNAGKNVSIELRGGDYNFDEAVLIASAEYKNRSLSILAYKNEKVVFSGARQYHLKWVPYKNGILKASLDIQQPPDRLYFNGASLPMARYPDFDSSARVFNGTAADAISDETGE
ncbi:MAG: DUF1565 domain-containing protein [Bacteroidota bacterium]